jgi:geranylgeranyl pyrophosphate synthase
MRSDEHIASIIAGDAPLRDARPSEHYDVPQDVAYRSELRAAARRYVAEHDITPPVPLSHLLQHAANLIARLGTDERLLNFAAVLVSNEIWRETVAAVPFDRRLLLIPQCLRSLDKCRGEMDGIGLLCAECGACPIGRLQAEAERLGYVVLVAEGTTVVTKLIEEGRVDAVVGVSCLSVLERTFAPMSENAIPGLAVPLLRDGCEDTLVDAEWVREAIHTRAASLKAPLDLEGIKRKVNSWFEIGCLQSLFSCDSETERLALLWLARAGKRWRPFLTVAASLSLTGADAADETLRRVAVAVECFHKASLVHDDIEDSDDARYGEATLHRSHGIPVALNVGDFLLGEGYRLLASSGAGAENVARMLAIAADGHRNLCLGQGAELAWMRSPRTLTTRDVVDMFRQKTAPAFEVALRLGAVAAEADEGVHRVMCEFSDALGIAYQARDDIRDLEADGDASAGRPSLLFAIAHQRADAPGRRIIEDAWLGRRNAADAVEVARGVRASETAELLLDYYGNEAIEALQPLRSVALKSLLRRAVGRILGANAEP